MKISRSAASFILSLVVFSGLQLSSAHADNFVNPYTLWNVNLGQYLNPNAAFPTQDTPVNAKDSAFQQWSWEAFTWATALNGNGIPRFMNLPTEDDLLSYNPAAWTAHPRQLRLAARSLALPGSRGFQELAGAFVEADGNILIAPNGYPVYASVHMNPGYFATAKQNMIMNGGYTNQPAGSTFNVGAAVFKAVWLRLDYWQPAPDGAFVTTAQVPVLTQVTVGTNTAIAPTGQFVTARVALVGLHVTGYTINHPEFIWATFEHKDNCPQAPDNTFDTNDIDTQNFTFYKAGTSFSEVNIAPIPQSPDYPLSPGDPPLLTFNEKTQRFSPINNVVLENQTGNETNPNGTNNVAAINQLGHKFFNSLRLKQSTFAQSTFANYNLIGSVWLAPNSYSITNAQLMANPNTYAASNAIGSVNLANSTAETFQQISTNSPANFQNCFECHNPGSYSFGAGSSAPLINRPIALSHVISVGTPFAVSNIISNAQ